MNRVLAIAFFCFGQSLVSFGQELIQSPVAYLNNIPLNQETISGGYYVAPPPTIEGDPYLWSRSFENGALTINGITYRDVPLLYNIYTDEIVTFHPEHNQKVLIKTDKINGFSFYQKPDSRFVKINGNEGYAHQGNGFYELIASGNASFLCKHYKTRKEKRELSKYSSEFLEKKDYWLQKGDEMRLVGKRKDIMEFLNLERKELRRLARENNILFKADKKSYILMVVSHVNEITP